MYLRQNTEVKVRMGFFADAADKVTPETGVLLTGGGDPADQAELLKQNGAATVDISGNTWADVTGCDGWYDLTLTASNTDTLGHITIVVQNASLHTPVKMEFEVVTANFYDSMFGTDKLETDIVQMCGVAQSATDLKDFADTGYDPAAHKIEEVKVLTGHTAQSGDSFAVVSHAANGNAAIKTAVNTVDGKVDTVTANTARYINTFGKELNVLS